MHTSDPLPPKGTVIQALILALAGLTGLGSAHAAAPHAMAGSPGLLDDFVVTATRVEEPSANLPYVSRALDQETLVERGTRTLPEALRDQSSIMVQKTSLGQGSPFIRGFTGFRTVLLVDGFRLNNSVFRDGPNQYWNTVDSWSVDKLELVKGPTSAQHGSDAIGGTVHARTLSPRFVDGSPVAFGRIAYRHGTAEHSNTGRVEAGAGLGRATAIVAGVTTKQFGDLRGGRDVGTQRNTGYDEFDVDVKLEHRFAPETVLTLAHQTVDQDDVWRTHATIYGLSWKGTRPASNLVRFLDQRRDLTYARFDATALGGAVSEVHAGIAHQRQSEDEFRRRANLRSETGGFDVDTLGTFAHVRFDTIFGRWVTGAEFYRDRVDSHLREFDASGAMTVQRIQGPVADDARYDIFGLFAENRFSLTPRIDVILGARLNRTETNAGKVAVPGGSGSFSIVTDTSAATANGRVLAALDRARRWKLFAGAAQGTRSPNLSDLTRFDIAEAGQIETPVSHLDPERFITAEAGLRGGFGRLAMELAYYHTSIEDLIVRTPTGREVNGLAEVTKRNSGQGYIHGVEFEAQAELTKELSVRGVLSWMEGTLESYPTAAPVLVEEPVSRLMPPSALAVARWERGAWWVEGTLRMSGRADRLSAQDRNDIERIPPGGTPGFVTYGLRAAWRAPRGLTVITGIENLTNEDYRIHGSGLNEPGRNVVLTVLKQW